MACEESFEIVPNEKAKSSVWNHFGFLKENNGPVDKTRVSCKLCPVKTILKYSGNTTNLTDLLRRKHRKFLKEQSESTSSDAKAATVKQTTHSSKQFQCRKSVDFYFFSQFCITCIVKGRWNGAFISNISFYLNQILIVTLKCHYRNSIAIVSPLSQYYCNGVSTIAILSQ